MPNTKGKVSPLLAAILRDRDASERLRVAIANGEDFVISIDGITFRIATSTQSGKSSAASVGNRPPPQTAQAT